MTAKVAVDADNVYFYAETADALTPSTGKNWMLLLIDADRNSNTGWYGYDFLINYSVLDGKATILMRYDPSSSQLWVDLAKLDYRYKGNAIEIKVTRRVLGLKGDEFTFDFHWANNPIDLKDPISLCTSGDSAPNRRFNYRYIWEK